MLSYLAGGPSDGAAVMAGLKGGAMTRLKALSPLFISTRCAAHRLALPLLAIPLRQQQDLSALLITYIPFQ